MKSGTLGFVALVSGLLSTAATAETITQYFHSMGDGVVEFQLFNKSIGTLNSVYFSDHMIMGGYFYRNPIRYDEVTQSYYWPDYIPFTSEVSVDIFGMNFKNDGSFEALPPIRDPVQIYSEIARVEYNVPTEGFAAFIGKGSKSTAVSGRYWINVTDPLLERICGPGWGCELPELPVDYHNIYLTYEYTAFVAEPASWAMMISGFGLVGATLRRPGGMRRSRKAAV